MQPSVRTYTTTHLAALAMYICGPGLLPAADELLTGALAGALAGSKPSGASTWPTRMRARRRCRKGQIWAFFATKEHAEKFTAARQTEGYDAIVVAATAKEVE